MLPSYPVTVCKTAIDCNSFCIFSFEYSRLHGYKLCKITLFVQVTVCCFSLSYITCVCVLRLFYLLKQQDRNVNLIFDCQSFIVNGNEMDCLTRYWCMPAKIEFNSYQRLTWFTSEITLPPLYNTGWFWDQIPAWFYKQNIASFTIEL